MRFAVLEAVALRATNFNAWSMIKMATFGEIGYYERICKSNPRAGLLLAGLAAGNLLLIPASALADSQTTKSVPVESGAASPKTVTSDGNTAIEFPVHDREQKSRGDGKGDTFVRARGFSKASA